jgi:pimeloyl-ACP methyl ester carboxylesterase
MGAYVDVDGLSMYYEAAGEGEPVVLIHGTGGTAESWNAQWDLLPDYYQLFMPDCRGHGRTADVEGPYTYENVADDIAGFIEALGLGPVRLVGWSNGANVVLRLALRRPDLVKRLVLINGTASWRQAAPVGMDAIAKLPMPLLVMQGDEDSVEITHSAALAGTAPDGRLAVVPGTSHVLPLEKPEIVNLLLLDFFEDKPEARLFPLGSLRSAADAATPGTRRGFVPRGA